MHGGIRWMWSGSIVNEIYMEKMHSCMLIERKWDDLCWKCHYEFDRVLIIWVSAQMIIADMYCTVCT